MAEPSSSKSRAGKFYQTLILILVLAVVGVWLWKEIEARGAAQRFEAEHEALVELSREALVRQTHEMLRLSAVPLGWSVRAEMIKENYAQVDDYLQRFVKEPWVEGVALVDHEGAIQVATDKKLEGRTAESTFPATALAVDRATVVDEGPEILLAVPIVSYDARLGTLIVSYSRESIEEKLPAPADEPSETASSDSGD